MATTYFAISCDSNFALLNFFYDKTKSRFFLTLVYDSNSTYSPLGSLQPFAFKILLLFCLQLVELWVVQKSGNKKNHIKLTK
jgi:hypothetical protein